MVFMKNILIFGTICTSMHREPPSYINATSSFILYTTCFVSTSHKSTLQKFFKRNSKIWTSKKFFHQYIKTIFHTTKKCLYSQLLFLVGLIKILRLLGVLSLGSMRFSIWIPYGFFGFFITPKVCMGSLSFIHSFFSGSLVPLWVS